MVDDVPAAPEADGNQTRSWNNLLRHLGSILNVNRKTIIVEKKHLIYRKFEKTTKIRLKMRPAYCGLMRLVFKTQQVSSLLLITQFSSMHIPVYMNTKYSWKGPVEPVELCDSDGNDTNNSLIRCQTLPTLHDCRHGGFEPTIHQQWLDPSWLTATPFHFHTSQQQIRSFRVSHHRSRSWTTIRVGTSCAVPQKLAMRSPALMEKACSSPEQLY